MSGGVDPGLCRTCGESQRITSAKGSVFWRCGRHDRDPSWRKYPALPVVRCSGYAPPPA